MTESHPESKKRYAGSRIVALTREEWEQDFHAEVRDGYMRPGLTYEGYLESLRRDFDWFCVPDLFLPSFLRRQSKQP